MQEKLNSILQDLKIFANSNYKNLSEIEIAKINSIRAFIKNTISDKSFANSEENFLCVECNEYGIEPLDGKRLSNSIDECFSIAQKNDFDCFAIYQLLNGKFYEVVSPEF